MVGDLNMLRSGARIAGLAGAALALAACGSSSVLSTSALDVFRSTPKATEANASAGGEETPTDIACPEVKVRTGAATLIIGSKPNDPEPSALDVRYQGSIIRTARECHVAAGVITMKVGVEGRVITGPAGGAGNVDVPLRIAVVQEGITPKPIVSKFARIEVPIAGAIDRATFTHIDSEISFPVPRPAGLIDAYVVFVGFDPLAVQPPKRQAPPKRAPRTAQPRQG